MVYNAVRRRRFARLSAAGGPLEGRYNWIMTAKKSTTYLLKKCPLCYGDKEVFHRINGKIYYQCRICFGISLDPVHFLEPEKEIQRYLEHQNDVNDIGYREFVQPVTSAILADFTPRHLGLDYGAGPGPVIARVLKEKSYNIRLYDPYFCPDEKYLERRYDYIVCSEVIEHFKFPGAEFKRLKGLLKNPGALYCLTRIYDGIDFKKWYYKNDPTHVFFYTAETIQWIEKHFDFLSSRIDTRRIIFRH